jgi:two-component system, NarL family, sensor histidine kinase DegS
MPRNDKTTFVHIQERFQTRARVLYYARLALMATGLAILVVPAWYQALAQVIPYPAYWYLFLLAYHVASYLWVDKKHAETVVFISLCLDVLALVYLVVATGGMKSPLMPTQLVLTMLFALLYPSPLAIVPPLLALPVVAKIDQIVGLQTLPGDLLLIVWYCALNVAVVYTVVYLEGRERQALKEVIRLQRQRRKDALDDQRTHIAREIHDGVGAALSGVLLQAEYLNVQTRGTPLADEVAELRSAAGEGMEELRRAVSILHREFQLTIAIPDYVDDFASRQRLQAKAEVRGAELPLNAEKQLATFRIVQEALANIAKHAKAKTVDVVLEFGSDRMTLTIRDDGVGFEPGQVKSGHYGLRNMRDRATKVGGMFDIDSIPGKGTTLELSLLAEPTAMVTVGQF